ncbi:MAG: hypothetical protein JXN61_11895 [Sedimentisphaerales bacterium]|nr:hypothetical protein [Sedimentisphaerales bacterium]
MRRVVLMAIVAGIIFLAGCKKEDSTVSGTTFADDLAFLKDHADVIVLSDSTGKSQVAVIAAMQGRIMTSSANGPEGLSFGWINRELIASGKIQQHINVFGGEDRFWLGPEGGQFSIFFKKGVEFDLEHWFTPAAIDTEPFELVSSTENSAVFKKDMELENYSETIFKLRADRTVKVLEKAEAVEKLGVTPGDEVKLVAFESKNRITNTGEEAWAKETGALSIWILGMFNPSPATTIVIPYKASPVRIGGPIVNDAYFGKVPAERLVVGMGVLFFSGDGKYRSKIGIPPRRARPVCGSYDAVNKVLTIVQYNKPANAQDYVNSMWEIQDEPYKGDVVNSYNDGPAEPGGKPLGPFYELETSSPAAVMDPNFYIEHTHRTFHLQGKEADLEPIAKATLGVTIAEIKAALKQ